MSYPDDRHRAEPHGHVHIMETGEHAHTHTHGREEHSHMHVHADEEIVSGPPYPVPVLLTADGEPAAYPGPAEVIPRRKQVKDLREGDLVRLYGTVVEIIGTPSPGASPHGTRRPPLRPGWMYVPMEWAGVRCAPPEEALTWVTVALPGDELPLVDEKERRSALAAQVTYPARDDDDESPGYLVTSMMRPRELEGRHCKWCGEYVTLRPARLPRFDAPYIAEFEHVKTGLVHCSLAWSDGNLVAVTEETAQACFTPGCKSNAEHEAGNLLVSKEPAT